MTTPSKEKHNSETDVRLAVAETLKITGRRLRKALAAIDLDAPTEAKFWKVYDAPDAESSDPKPTGPEETRGKPAAPRPVKRPKPTKKD